MSKYKGLYEDRQATEEDKINYNTYITTKEVEKDKLKRARRTSALNEVGVVPAVPPEVLEEREIYRHDFVLAHKHLFKNSTGLLPLSDKQIESCRHSQDFVHTGSKVCKVEFRGSGKTSRGCNEGTTASLNGDIDYLLILGSTTEKALEIVESITTEILENEDIERLYPATVACFKHWQDNPRRAEYQTYNGERTHIKINKGLIKFPIIPGEPSAGCVINVRPKKNVRGIYFTEKAGPFAGRRRRPSHVFFDDIQTDEDARNPQTVQKIIDDIKRGVLRSGGHTTRSLACMMACTPIAANDVTYHFSHNEPWQLVSYGMLEKRAKNEHLWLQDYANIRRSFDRRVPGSLIKAQLASLEFFKENMEAMLEDAVATWEECYNRDDPQTEIHAVQHAYNILIDEGEEVFESECQCNVQGLDIDPSITVASVQTISSAQVGRTRRQVEVDERTIVTAIDVNLPYFTWMTVSSPENVRPAVIDYGSWPSYPSTFDKRTAHPKLADMYKSFLTAEDRTYQGLLDLLNWLIPIKYPRVDGVELYNKYIGVDSRWHMPQVHRAIRSCVTPSIVYPMVGWGVAAKDKVFAERPNPSGGSKFHNGMLNTTADNTMLRLDFDGNAYKTETHEMFSRPPGTTGAATFFDQEFPRQHEFPATHMNGETPMIDICPKTGKQKVIWTEFSENEYFDNFTGCLAILAYCGINFNVGKTPVAQHGINIEDYFAQQL